MEEIPNQGSVCGILLWAVQSSHRLFVTLGHAAFAAEVRGNMDNQRRAGVENLSLVVHEIAAET